MAETTSSSTATPPRGRKLTDQQKHEILAVTANGSSRRFAAKCVGCSTSTITRLMMRDPEFRAKMHRAECHLESECLAAIRQAGKLPQHWKARGWLLERSNPERFALRRPGTVTVTEMATFFSMVLMPFAKKLSSEGRLDLIHQFDLALAKFRQEQAGDWEIRPEDDLHAEDFLSEADFDDEEVDQPGGGATPAQDQGTDPSADNSVNQAAEATYDEAPADASARRDAKRGATPARNSSDSGAAASSPTRPSEVQGKKDVRSSKVNPRPQPSGFSLDDLADSSPTAGFRILRDWPEGAAPIAPEDWLDLLRRNPNTDKENPSRGSSASAGGGAKPTSNRHPAPRKER